MRAHCLYSSTKILVGKEKLSHVVTYNVVSTTYSKKSGSDERQGMNEKRGLTGAFSARRRGALSLPSTG